MRAVLGTFVGAAAAAFASSLYASPPAQSAGVNRVVYQNASELLAGKPLGDGLQQKTGMAQSRERPDVIYLSQDVAAPSVSLDGGLTWYLPRWVGLRSHLTQGVMCDPLDPRRVAVITNEVYLEQTGEAGLYVSFDGGQTATRKVTWVGADSVHAASQGIGFNPASESGGKANRWVFIGAAASGDFPLHESQDGMETFSSRGTFAFGTYGLVKHVIGDPVNDNRYLVAFSTGLYWLNNAHSGSISFQKISGTGSLPNGAVNGPPYVSTDGQTIVVGVAGNGVWKSTNGGSSWSSVSAQAALHKLFVNWMNPDYMAITRNTSGSAGTPMFSQNDSTFSVPSTLEKRPGFTGTLSPGYQHNHVAWLNATGELWYAGRHTSVGAANNDYRSSDGGLNLVLSMQGMNGMHLGPLLNGGAQIFDPADKNRVGLPGIDFGWSISTDGLRSMENHVLRTVANGGVRVNDTHSTVHGAILHPTLNRAVVGMNTGTSGYLYVLNNGTWSQPSGTGSDRYHGLCYNTDTLVAFGGALRSNDWINWSTTGGPGTGYKVVGCTLSASGGQAIFAIDEGASPKSRNLKRTTDDGSTWTVVLTAGFSMMGGEGFSMGPFVAHPSNRDIVFTRDPTGAKIRKWDLSGGTVTTRPYVDLDPLDGATADFTLSSLAIDPRQPDVLYARNGKHGTGYKLMRTDGGGSTGTWSNLSALVPDGRTQFVGVHPLTGEVLYTTASGMWLLHPPYAQAGKLGDALQLPGNMLKDNYLGIGMFESNRDVGAVGIAGSASLDSGTGTYTVGGGGTDIYGASDQFHFLNRLWTGDVRFMGRVLSQTTPQTHNWAKAGFMLRDDFAADSRHVHLGISPQATFGGSVQMLSRSTPGGSTAEPGRHDGNAMPFWLRLERRGDVFTGWHSFDGALWLRSGSTTLALNTSLLAGLAVTARDNAKLNTATFDNVVMDAPPSWSSADVGSVGTTGSTSIDHAADVFTLNGAGSNIYNAADSFHFCYLTLTGDATIVAEVTDVEYTHNHAKGGLMIRQSLDANSAHATISIKPGSGATPGVEFLRRPSSGGSTGHSAGSPVAGVSPPRFLKLVRSGDSFSAYESNTGATWNQVGATETIAMSGTVYVGLIACSLNTADLCTVTFESVFVK